MYKQYGEMTFKLNQLRQKRNETAEKVKSISLTLSKKPTDKIKVELENNRKDLLKQGKTVKESIQALELTYGTLESHLFEHAVHIPNDTHPATPVGDESCAQAVKIIGKQIICPVHNADGKDSTANLTQELQSTLNTDTSNYSKELSTFPLQNHYSIGEKLDLFDFENAAKISGTSFYYLRHEAALLELALVNYAMQFISRHKFTPIITPDIIKKDIASACGYQPRNSDATQNYDVYHSSHGALHEYHAKSVLSGTAEIPLAGMFSDSILSHSELPISMVAFGRCFRAEAGSRGSENRGLYRVHQFSKVEMFSITSPMQSDSSFQKLIEIQESLFKSLGICFRVLNMPTAELGNAAYQKYDMEAWMGGRNTWGEISSASNCTDFQSRRLNIRFRERNGDIKFVHTLNATGCAIPRMIISILEGFQLENGDVVVPEVLRPFMGGVSRIRAKKKYE
ncbi:hypothetical protein BKA69DRAFT_1035435 [Paraphysoderma sedebokerense]|nr:hypothetical protein BKA69DRAFT_1035435 [Paraphysoderma sedebokerense]